MEYTGEVDAVDKGKQKAPAPADFVGRYRYGSGVPEEGRESNWVLVGDPSWVAVDNSIEVVVVVVVVLAGLQH